MAVIAFFDGKEVWIFKGKVDGKISGNMRGNKGFGFDPIFLYDKRTFAEMGDEKNEVSHRRKALETFFSWLKEQNLQLHP
jgi:XTP/dITP diphosphohydrolase